MTSTPPGFIPYGSTESTESDGESMETQQSSTVSSHTARPRALKVSIDLSETGVEHVSSHTARPRALKDEQLNAFVKALEVSSHTARPRALKVVLRARRNAPATRFIPYGSTESTESNSS